MPTYEYTCPAGHDFELFQRMSDKPRAKCPACGKIAVRKISGGAGLHFKGSGFYITDYGKDGKGPRNDKAQESSESPKPITASDNKSKGTESSKPAAEKPAAAKPEKAPAKKAKTSE